MSTYLVAYVIGAYDHVEARDRNGVLVRVYTPLGKKDQGLFALHVSFSEKMNDVSDHNERVFFLHRRPRRKFFRFTRIISALNIH